MLYSLNFSNSEQFQAWYGRCWTIMINSIILFGWHVIYFIFLKYKTVNLILKANVRSEAEKHKICIPSDGWNGRDDARNQKRRPKHFTRLPCWCASIFVLFLFPRTQLSDVWTSELVYEPLISLCSDVDSNQFFFHEMFRIVVLNIYLIRHRWTLIESVIMAATRKPEHVFTSFLRCDATAVAHVVTRLLRSNKYRAYKHEWAIKRQWLRYGMSTT